MKIKSEHYAELKSLMATACANVGAEKMAEHHFKLAGNPAVKDLSKRMRWDMFWCATRDSSQLMREIYKYAHDDHLDTALKKIAIELEIPQ